MSNFLEKLETALLLEAVGYTSDRSEPRATILVIVHLPPIGFAINCKLQENSRHEIRL